MMKINISESLLSLNVQALLYLVFVGVLMIFVRKSLMGKAAEIVVVKFFSLQKQGRLETWVCPDSEN